MGQLIYMTSSMLLNATTGEQPSLASSMGGMIIWIVVLVALFYFMLIRPQKKREKEIKTLQDSLQIGDEIVTNGGIVGIVTSMKEDTIVVETGTGSSKIRFKRYAVAEVTKLNVE